MVKLLTAEGLLTRFVKESAKIKISHSSIHYTDLNAHDVVANLEDNTAMTNEGRELKMQEFSNEHPLHGLSSKELLGISTNDLFNLDQE